MSSPPITGKMSASRRRYQRGVSGRPGKQANFQPFTRNLLEGVEHARRVGQRRGPLLPPLFRRVEPERELRGIDLSGNYAVILGGAGRLSFGFNGSVALDSQLQTNPTQPAFDCVGLYGPTCTGEGPTSPIPQWRHQLRTTWRPGSWGEISLNWRHVGVLNSEFGSRYPHLQGNLFPEDARIAPYDYFDLAGEVDVTSKVTFRAGVNNLFDRNPPVAGANNNPQLLAGNMVASIYDTLGRFLFVGLTTKF